MWCRTDVSASQRLVMIAAMSSIMNDHATSPYAAVGAKRGHQPYVRMPTPSTNSAGSAMFTPALTAERSRGQCGRRLRRPGSPRGMGVTSARSRPSSQCSRPTRRATRCSTCPSASSSRVAAIRPAAATRMSTAAPGRQYRDTSRCRTRAALPACGVPVGGPHAGRRRDGFRFHRLTTTCAATTRCTDMPARWPAGSPRRWRRVQGTRNVGHLQVKQGGGLELRGDPSD
jgi:hypothetical protein